MEIQISCRILSFFIIINVLIIRILRKKRRKVTKNNYDITLITQTAITDHFLFKTSNEAKN
jgi:hypothetical protein